MSAQESDLYELSMSEESQPLMAAVKKHIEENVEPITEEFEALHQEKEDRWSWHPRQLELLEGAKNKAKESGLWNFFLPDSDSGEGLTNLDYAYIAAELGKYGLDIQSTAVIEKLKEFAIDNKYLRPDSNPPLSCKMIIGANSSLH